MNNKVYRSCHRVASSRHRVTSLHHHGIIRPPMTGPRILSYITTQQTNHTRVIGPAETMQGESANTRREWVRGG